MGNLCSGPSSVEKRRRRHSRRAGSGSTTGFSPTEDPAYLAERNVATASEGGAEVPPRHQRSRDAGGDVKVSTSEVHLQEQRQTFQDDHSQQQPGLEPSRRSDRSLVSGDGDLDPHHQGRSRRESSRERDPPPSAGTGATGQALGDAAVGNSGGGGVGSADEDESGEERSEKSDRADRKHRDRGQSGEPRRPRHGDRQRSRPSGSGKDAKEGGGSSRSRGRDGDRDGERRNPSNRPHKRDPDRGDPSARRSDRRPEKDKERRQRPAGELESEEARRERKERKERRERRKAKEAAAAAAASAGGEGAGNETAAGGGSTRRSSTAGAGDGLQGSTDSRREHRERKNRRKEAAAATSEARAEEDGKEDGTTKEHSVLAGTEIAAGAGDVVAGSYGTADGEAGAGTAVAAVVAEPVVVAEAMAMPERKGKRGSSLRKVSCVYVPLLCSGCYVVVSISPLGFPGIFS